MLLCHNLIVIITISGLVCAQAQNEIRDHYSFNHPPLIETLESVASPSPVAVAYKSGDAREEKSIDLSTNYQTTSEEESYPTKKNYETIPGYIENKSSEIEEPEKLENKNEGHSFSNSNSIKIPDLEIPVNVVYDTESGVEYVNKGNDQIINRSNKKQKQVTRRLYKSKINEIIKDEVAINDNENKEEKSIGNTVSIKSSTPLPLENNELNTASPMKIVKERRRMRTRPPVVPIVTEKNFVYGHSGNFHYSFEGGDGTKVFEEGSLKTINDDTGEAVYGGFSYKDKDGKDYSLSYTADENGYQPIGAHLPTPPPIPPAIARALAYLATKSIPQSTEATKKFA